MKTHSPGPWVWYWTVENDRKVNCGVVGGFTVGMPVSICRAPSYVSKEQWRADASLISAAPDLLAVCKALIRFHAHRLDTELTTRLRVAISKAEGQGEKHEPGI